MSDQQPPWHRIHLWQIQSLRDVALIAIIIGIFYLGYVLQIVTVPLLVGLGLAYAFEPMIAWASRRWSWATRGRCIVAAFSAVLSVMILVVLLVLPAVIREGSALVQASGSYVKQGRALLLQSDLPESVTVWIDQLPWLADSSDVSGEVHAPDNAGTSSEQVSSTPMAKTQDESDQEISTIEDSKERVEPARDIAAKLTQTEATVTTEANSADSANTPATNRQAIGGNVLGAAGRTVTAIGGFLGKMVGGIFNIGLFIFLTGFFFAVCSSSWPAIRACAPNWVPQQWRGEIAPLLQQMDGAVSGFIRGRLTITTILMAWFAIGWWLCGVPHAIVLGLVIGALTLVPYVSVIGLPLAWALLVVSLVRLDPSTESWYRLMVDGEAQLIWWKILLFPGLIYLGAQLLDDYVSPIIQGKATDLSMAAIIVAVLVGGELAGLYGMLLAIPAAACVKIGLRGLIWPRVTAWLDGRRSDPLL